jgi:hypothetical protein
MKTFEEFLNESPLYHDKELDLKDQINVRVLRDKTYKNLEDSFNLFAKLEPQNLEIWFNGYTFVVGSKRDEMFDIVMQITTRGKNSFPTTPNDIVPGVNSFQVSWAELIKPLEGTGIAKLIYLKIIDKVGSITSDNEQYKGAKRLWLSLSNNISVYVWDGTINDYVRDAQGKKLELKQVDSELVWGSTPNYRNILLVALK